MKKETLLTLFLLTFGISTSYAQSVNDIPLKDIDVEYVQIIGTSRLFSNKLIIEIDFGQENKFWSEKDTRIKDEKGKIMTFNSIIDALNFMSKNGYKFVNAHTTTNENWIICHYYLLQKK